VRNDNNIEVYLSTSLKNGLAGRDKMDSVIMRVKSIKIWLDNLVN